MGTVMNFDFDWYIGWGFFGYCLILSRDHFVTIYFSSWTR